MPDHHSSNELVIELVRELLAERGRDLAEGISLRGLDRKFSDHLTNEEHARDRFDSRLRELEMAVARGSAFDEMPTSPAGFAPLAIPINLQPLAIRSKRPSIPAWIKSGPMKAAAHWVGMVLIAAVVAFVSRCERVVGVEPHPTAPPAVSR